MRNLILDPIWGNVFTVCIVVALALHRSSIKKLRRDLEDANNQIADLNQRLNKFIKSLR